MNILPIRFGVALGVAAIAGVALAGSAGVATGSVRRGPSTRTATRTVTVTKTVLATTTQPGVPAFVSQNLAAFGGSVTSPAGPYRAHPSEITFSSSPVGGPNLAVYVDHLSWVDWGQPVAYASGIVHTRDWQQNGFIATPGGAIVDQLLSCEGRSYYTYSELLAPAGFPSNSQSTEAMRRPGARAARRCRLGLFRGRVPKTIVSRTAAVGRFKTRETPLT